MANYRLGTIMLTLGVMLGSGATIVLRQPEAAVAQQSMSGMSMGMKSRSAGDAEMNNVMNQMSKEMATMKLTGVQDRDFMMMMIPHHMSAVGMAKIELRRGTHPELKSLARNVISSQDREIGQMQRWLKAWYGQGV